MRSFGLAPARLVSREFDGDRALVRESGSRMGDIANAAAGHNVSLA
ncbi:MAG: hypothetical protein GVY15_12440 [Bacteroidetes bacterium]|jgi:hypothetical protein|nr:hypothetical protein [Bacteroidota bacterium]